MPSRDPYSDTPVQNPTERASDALNTFIKEGGMHEDITVLDERLAQSEPTHEGNPVPLAPEENTETYAMPVREALEEEPVLETVSQRDSVRVLIFTRDTTVLTLGSIAQQRIVELSNLFSEIHVVVLSLMSDEEQPTVRLTDTVWLYSTESTSWWKTAYDAYRIAHEQLVFAGGFRADIIVAHDPFESACAGYGIARKYDRPLQIHILEDIYEEEFKTRDPQNGWRLLASKYILPRASCIRVRTENLKKKMLEAFPKKESHIEVLPLYYNLEVWRNTVPTVNLKERYPQFKFIILHVSGMMPRSHTSEVIEGVTPLLRMYPTIGLVIIGSGPLRAHIEKQILALGIQNQIALEPHTEDVISYMKSANVLIHLSEDSEEDITILEAATVKLPMIASRESLAGTLLADGESAYICEAGDAACVSYRLRSYLNDNLSRTRFAMSAEEAAFSRIEQDYGAYLEAYRASIERCI